MKYKVGDKVRIIGKIINSCNDNSLIEKYLGSIMTIKYVNNTCNNYNMIEDSGKYKWNEDMIECLVNEPKYLETWEMVKKLTEYPNKKFKDIDGMNKDSYVTVSDGVIIWLGEGQEGQKMSVSMDKCKWEEINDSITFIEVLEIVKGNNFTNITLQYDELNIHVTGKSLDWILRELGDRLASATISKILLEGEFYITE